MLIETTAELQTALRNAAQAGEVGFDTETTSLDIHELDWIGFSFSFHFDGAMPSYYVSLSDELSIPFIRDMLNEFFASDVMLVFHNAGYDLNVLSKYDFHPDPERFTDTMIESWLYNENQRNHKLKVLVKKYLKIEMTTFEEMLEGKGDIRDVPLEQVAQYAADDARYTLQLHEHFKEQLQEQELEQARDKIELPLIPVVSSMIRAGVQVDTNLLDQFKVQATEFLSQYDRKIKRAVGHEFNINSVPQLRKILFEDMQLPVTVWTDGGKSGIKKPSTGEKALKFLSERGVDFAEDILKYRWYKKLDGTFLHGLTPKEDTTVGGLNLELDDVRGRIYPGWFQIGTVTGRFASGKPVNMQNFPVESELGIRGCVVPYSDDNYMIVVDYGQIELCFLAHFSEDPNLVRAFNEGLDIHQMTADLMGVSRKHGKTFNFAILYGLSPGALAASLGCSLPQAYDYINGWFRAYPRAAGFKQFSENFLQEKGYVRTVSFRKRRLPDVYSLDMGKRGYAIRQGFNSVVQGSAADLMKLAMIRLYERWHNQPPMRMMATVHDELVFSARGTLEQCIELGREAKHIMETAITLRVPIRADMVICDNWWWGKYEDGDKVPELLREPEVFQVIA